MSDIQIRAVEPEDWPDLAELWNQPQAIAGTLQMPYRSRELQRQRLTGPAPAGLTRLGAVMDGKLIGVAGLTRLEGRRSHVGTIFIAVHDAFHGRGAGGALMGAMIGIADNWMGLHRLELTVFADNTRAIGLYERFGFAREGLHRDFAFRDGAYADTLAMARIRTG